MSLNVKNQSKIQLISLGDLISMPWGRVFSMLDNSLHDLHPDSIDGLERVNDFLEKISNTFPLVKQPPSMSIPYEEWIFNHQTIPTRANWHDYLNSLIWAVFPNTKRKLNQIQAQEIKQHGIDRTFVRDAGTLFDENGAVLLMEKAHWENRLRERDWIGALWKDRNLFCEETRLILFGHALLEKLFNPYKAITAHVLCVPVDLNLLNGFDWQWGWKDEKHNQQCDEVLVKHINHLYENKQWISSVFTPVPVAGIPGWAKEQNLTFYKDQQVFRVRSNKK
jgi:hypothetical protein